MLIVKVGRLLVALVFAGIAAYCVYSFATMPYELVTTTNTTTRTEVMPMGVGFILIAFFAILVALVAAFSGDWD